MAGVTAGSGPLALGWDDLRGWEGVGSAYAGALDGIDAVLRDRGQRRTSPEQTVESLLRGAVASAALADSTSTPEQIRAGDLDAPAAAAVRLSTGLLALVPVVRTAPLQAFARLHALAAGPGGSDSVGRPKDVASARRLQSLAGAMRQTSVPGLLVAAVVHAEIATLEPFGSHDGLIARAAERLLLAARGVDPRSLTVPEAGHAALRAQYESNLRAYASYAAESPAGPHAWLLYAPEAYTRGAESSVLRGM